MSIKRHKTLNWGKLSQQKMGAPWRNSIIEKVKGFLNTQLLISLILSIKAILLGEHNTGRTLIFNRIVGKTTNAPIAFSGITTGYRIFILEDTQIQLGIWDYSGRAVPFGSQVRFFSGTHAVLVIFDISDFGSFIAARKWVQQVRNQYPAAIVAVLGNKADLPRNMWEIYEEDLEKLSFSTGALKAVVSAKTGQGLQEILESTVLEVIREKD
ncbi:MAG: ADP-ribosylation factor-like protein [Candidatus Thorarchaeota archaeon]